VFGLVGASMFYPDFMGSLGHFFKENASMLTMFLLIGFIIFLMSGLLKPIANLFPSGDVGTLIIALVLFFIGIIIAANVGGPQSG